MLDRFTWLVDGLVVLPERMRANLDASHGLFFSQRVLLALVEAGLPRDEAYRLVQGHALRAWDEGLDFRALVEGDERIAGRIDLAAAFDLGAYTRHVDAVFDRLHALTANGRPPMSETLIHVASGKVRELFTIDDDRLLLVASDRISTFDVVLPTEIPDKGRVLTGLSGVLVRADARRLSRTTCSGCAPDGRSTECRRLEMLPLECVVRGYLAGSGWKDYQRTRLDVRARAAGGAARVGPAAGADLHALDQGDERATTRTSTPSRRSSSSARERYERGRAHRARAVPLRRRARRRARDPHRRHEVRVRSRRRRRASSSPTRPSRPTRPASGPPTSTRRAARSRPSTSSSSATTASRSAGTRRRPGPELPEDVVAGTRGALRRGVRAPDRDRVRRLPRRPGGGDSR